MTDRVNVADFGAVSDGVTNDHAAIVAAITAGHTQIVLPAHTRWIPADDLIPGGVQYFGGDWETTIIEAADPQTGVVLLGPRASLYNVALVDAIEPGVEGLGGKSKRPVREAHNLRPVPAQVQHYAYQALYIATGMPGRDHPSIAINLDGLGDGIFVGANEDSAAFHAWGNPSDRRKAASCFLADVFGNGPGLQINGEPGCTPFALARIRQKADVAALVLDPTVPTGEAIIVTDSVKTAGQMIHLFHSRSDYRGTPVLIDMANGSGSFTEPFLDCVNHNVSQASIDHDGTVNASGYSVGHTKGASGSFRSKSGKRVTVVNGLITRIA